MALKFIDGKKIVYDDCEALPSVGWGNDYKSSYAMVTGGAQNVNNPDDRTGIKLSSKYARKGTRSYQLYVTKRTDYPACCEWTRSEVMWMDPGYQNESNEWNFAAVSTLIDPTVNLGAQIRYQIAYDHKEAPDNRQTPFWLGIKAGRYIIAGLNIGSEVDLGPVTKGVWEDWVLHRNWLQNGFLKFYRNGKLVYEKTGDMRVNSYIARIQHGIYKWAWQNSNNQNEGAGGPADDAPIIMYIDELRFGLKGGTATLQDFLLDSTAPPVVVDPPPIIIPPISAPTIIAIPDITTDKNTADIKVTAKDNTANGHIKSFSITQVSGPNTAKVTQYNQSGWRPTTTNFKFDGLLDGIYEFKVTTVDDLGNTASDNFKITRKTVDTTNYYVGSVESTENIPGGSYKSIIITWRDGTKTELYKKP